MILYPTCKELFIFNDRDVPVEAWDIKELGPSDPGLEDVRALPVIKMSPGRQNQHPVFAFPQGLKKGSNANVDISAKVEPFRGVYIIQKVSGENTGIPFFFWEHIEAVTRFSFLPCNPVMKLLDKKAVPLFEFVVPGRGRSMGSQSSVCYRGWRGH